MRRLSSGFFHYGTLVVFLSWIVGFGVLGVSPSSHAQDSGQSAAPPATAAQPKQVVVLPDGDGKEIATEYCQDCHKLTNLTKASKSADEWRDSLQLMMDRGARLPQEKVDPLLQYLVKNFGPKAGAPQGELPATTAPAAAAPAAAAPASTEGTAAPSTAKAVVILPDGDGKDIATENCQACHKLTNLTKAHKSLDDWRDTVQLMMDRGANVPADKVDTLVQYLAKNFGPKAESSAGAPSSAGPASTTAPSNP